jgi:hypothetical protein
VLQQKEKSYTSDQFIKIYKDVQDSLLPHLQKEEKPEVELVMGAVKAVGNDFNEETMKVFDFNDEHEPLLKEWIAGDDAGKIKFELLYKATRDTFSSYTMHQMIDNKGPTVGIIKSEHNKVFGGYCEIDWKPDGAWKPDPKAFIFSMTNKTKHEQY